MTAGEYGDSLAYFAHLLAADTVDCVQVDVTRCGGYTEWRRIAALAASYGLEVSGHCAPSLHAAVAMATPTFVTSSGSATTSGSRGGSWTGFLHRTVG